jgi:hypothetical protein
MNVFKRQLVKLQAPLNVFGIHLVVSTWFSLFYYWDTSCIFVQRLKTADRLEYLNIDYSSRAV